MRTPLARAMMYAATSGAVFVLLPMAIGLFLDRGSLFIVVVFGFSLALLAFVAAILDHREPETTEACLPPASSGNGFKFWILRVFAALFLSTLAAAFTCTVVAGLCDLYLRQFPMKRGSPAHLKDVIFVINYVMAAVATGAFLGCWAGAILAPSRNTIENLARWGFLASIIASLTAATGGAIVGALTPRIVPADLAILVCIVIGVFASSLGAIATRWLVRRRQE